MTPRRWARPYLGIAVVVALAASTWASAAPAGAVTTSRAPKSPAGRSHLAASVPSTPPVGKQFTFTTRTEITTSGTPARARTARASDESSPSSAGTAQGLLVAPQPVSALAALIGGNGGVISLASGEFSASGHQDVAAVICNPCGGWANPPYQPATDGQYSIAVLPGNGDGTFGTPTQLSPVGPNIALDAIVAADLGNGHDDLVVSENDPGSSHPYQFLIYLGNGQGSFASPPVTVDAPGPIVRFQVADLGNGHPDLVAVVTGGADGNEVVVFTGDGTGNFTAGAPMPLCPGLPSGCPSGDSLTDLVVAPLAIGGEPDILVSSETGYALNNGYQSSTDTVAVLANNGSGTFAAPAYPVTDMNDVNGMEVGDFTDPSGPPELLLVGTCLGAVSSGGLNQNCQMLLVGNGDGTFQTPSASDATEVEPDSMRTVGADTPVQLTSGGRPDALWLTSYGNNQSGAVEAMVNTGGGNFTREELPGVLPGAVYASSVIPVDLAGDGQPDLVVGGGPIGSLSSSPGLWVVPASTNDPGDFLAPQGYLGFVGTQNDQSVAVGDFRSTGNQDIVTVTRGAISQGPDLTLLPGNGDGTFGPAQAETLTGAASVSPRWGMVTGDFSGNGNLDIAYLDASGALDYQMGNGDGTFSPVVQVPAAHGTPGPGNADLVLTTLNGQPDIIESDYSGSVQYLESYLWDPATSGFSAPVVSGPLPSDAGGDGDIGVGHFSTGDRVDVATVVQPSGGKPEVEVITGNTDGSFDTTTPTAVASPCSTATRGSNFSYGAIAVGDLGNGHDDIVWQCIDALYVALGNGDGTFQPVESYPEPPGAASAPPGNDSHLLLADLEGNGHPDAVSWGGDYDLPDGMAIWHNNGDGTFASASLYSMGIPMNGVGETITAAPLTSPGSDDLIVLGVPEASGTDQLSVFLAGGGRPALEATRVSVPAPSTPVPGSIVTGTYQVIDTASAVSGSWQDSVYLAPGATGTAWTDSDTLLGRVPETQSLAPGGSYTGEYSFPLAYVPAGTYHLIVVPDSGDVLSGGNETPGASSGFSIGPVPTLSVGTPVDTSIQAGQSLYYQVPVGSAADVQVTVGPSSPGEVTLYGANGQPPTPQTAATASTSGTLTLPSSNPGTWFLVVQPSAAVGTTAVPITLTATNLGLTLDTVSPTSHTIAQVPAALPCAASAAIVRAHSSISGGGGVYVVSCPPPPPPPPVGDGLMTLTLQGSGFGPDLSVALVDGSTTYTATTVIRRDSTVAFASFPVEPYVGGAPAYQPEPGQVQPGTYDVVVTSGGNQMKLAQGFTVGVSGGGYYSGGGSSAPPALSVSFAAPAELRQGFVGQLAVTLRNNATSDIAIPVVTVSSPDALLGAPGVSDTTKFTSTLEFDDPVLSANPLTDPSPPGILGAGQSFTLELGLLAHNATAHEPLDTTTVVVNSSDTTPVSWSAILAPDQPGTMSNGSWSSVVSDFGSDVGSTEGAYALALVGAFAEADADGVALTSEADALNFLVQKELATGAGSALTGTVSMAGGIPPGTLVPLSLTDAAADVYGGYSWYDGRFDFWDVPPGSYQLTAAGYLPRPAADVTLPSGPLSLVVEPGGSLTGVVSNVSTGLPVAGATVSATDADGTLSSTPTPASGAFSIPGVDPGSVTVQASAPALLPSSGTVSVAAGPPTTDNISLSPGASVSGTITAPGGGEPPVGTTVAATPSSGSPTYGTVGTVGTFEIGGLGSGTYTVTAVAAGVGAGSVPATITGATSVSGLAISLLPEATVTGTVTDTDSGAALAGVVVTSSALSSGTATVTDAAGDFTLTGLSPGQQYLEFIPPDTGHLQKNVSVDLSAGTTTDEEVTLDPPGSLTATVETATGTPLSDVQLVLVGPAPGSNPAQTVTQSLSADSVGIVTVPDLLAGSYDLQVVGSTVHQAFTVGTGSRQPSFTLEVPTAVLAGTVEGPGGTPAPGVTVTAQGATGVLASTQTASDGTYALDLTAPGTVSVIAEGSPIGVYVEPGQSAALGGTTAVPTIEAGTATLPVSVTDGSGAVANATVTLALSGGHVGSVATTTNGSGSAILSDLQPGDYALSVSDGTDAPASQAVVVGAGTNPVVPITLGPAGSITGTVVDGSGAVVGATVAAVAGSAREMTSTGAGGAYTLAALTPGSYSLSVSNPGDAPIVLSGVAVAAGPATDEDVTLAATGSDVTTSLAPAGRGDPIPPATVSVLDATGTEVESIPLGPAVATSDASDTVSLGPLAAGAYTLQLTGPGLPVTSQSVSLPSATAAIFTAPSPVGLEQIPAGGIGPTAASPADREAAPMVVFGAHLSSTPPPPPTVPTLSAGDLIAIWLGDLTGPAMAADSDNNALIQRIQRDLQIPVGPCSSPGQAALQAEIANLAMRKNLDLQTWVNAVDGYEQSANALFANASYTVGNALLSLSALALSIPAVTTALSIAEPVTVGSATAVGLSTAFSTLVTSIVDQITHPVSSPAESGH